MLGTMLERRDRRVGCALLQRLGEVATAQAGADSEIAIDCQEQIASHLLESASPERVDDALQRMKRKAEWREEGGAVSMSDCARFFGSDGFTVC